MNNFVPSWASELLERLLQDHLKDFSSKTMKCSAALAQAAHVSQVLQFHSVQITSLGLQHNSNTVRLRF